MSLLPPITPSVNGYCIVDTQHESPTDTCFALFDTSSTALQRAIQLLDNLQQQSQLPADQVLETIEAIQQLLTQGITELVDLRTQLTIVEPVERGHL